MGFEGSITQRYLSGNTNLLAVLSAASLKNQIILCKWKNTQQTGWHLMRVCDPQRGCLVPGASVSARVALVRHSHLWIGFMAAAGWQIA